MKILVDELPDSPIECPFYDGHKKCSLYGWNCSYFETRDPDVCALMTFEKYMEEHEHG